MKAITLWPEWAWAVTRLGKNVENRPKKTNMPPGTEIAIHAGVAFGGSNKKYIQVKAAFDPVGVMAKRAGWRIAANVAENEIVGYSTKDPVTFTDRVHEMPQGKVVAVAIFAGLLEPNHPFYGTKGWPWWAGDQYGYILEKVKVLREPVYVRGQQGIWNLKEPELTEVLSQIRGQ